MNHAISAPGGQIRIRPSIFALHPAGIAGVTITGVKLVPSKFEDWAARLRFDLESDVSDDQGRPRLLRSYVSTTFSPGSKLEEVALATLGRSASDFGPQEELLVDQMVGETCRVVVKHDTKDGKTRALVDEWLPGTDTSTDDEVAF